MLEVKVALSLSKVEHSFPAVGHVMSPISLDVQDREFVALLGPSGCGKSTLLRLIAGLEQPSGGVIERNATPAKRGFVFQEAHLLPWRTVLENVTLPLELTKNQSLKISTKSEKISPSAVAKKAKQALAQVGLDDASELYPKQLSGGMKMRVALARALVTEPTLLLLDEPFAALDEVNRFALQENLRSLWRSLPMTVLFVTHSVSEAAFLATRVIVLSDRPARILYDGEVQLPADRNKHLRTSLEMMREIEALNEITSSAAANLHVPTIDLERQ